MPASTTMAAPFGRIMSGRGFAPDGPEAHDLPAAGQFTRDLTDFQGTSPAEAWRQQAKMIKSLQGMQRHGSSNQIPSVMPGLRPFRGADDAEALQQAAKRPRLMLPDYGRSASDPPLSFQRRNAHAMNVPVETLKLAVAKPAAAQMPKTLRSVQSGPARVDGKPSPNYRIYSNAFQAGRVDGEGGPLNYSHPKAAISPPSPIKAPTPSQQPVRNDPTPHPAFLKQPLLSSCSARGTSQQPGQHPEQASAAEALHQKRKEAGKKVHSEVAASSRPQQMHSARPDSSSDPSPQPASSPRGSASESTRSEADTEMEEASHVVASAQEALPRAAGTSPQEAGDEGGDGLGETRGRTNTPGVSTSKSPAAGHRGSHSPTSRDGTAFGGEGDSKRKSLDSRDSRDASRKPPAVKTDVSSKGRPMSKAAARPWSNLSSALQPAGGVQDTYPPAQQAADVVKKNDLHREAIMAEGNLQQLLQQLKDTQGQVCSQHDGMSRTHPQEHFLAGHSNSHAAPLQAPLHVMRNSFNRLARSEAEQAGGYPQTHPSGPSSFPPSGLSPHGQEHHRGFTAPKHKFGAINPRVGPASQQPLMPISSSTLSSLPPSVAAFYESEQQRQQHHQQHAMGPGSVLNRHLNGIKYSHQQQLAQQQAQQHGGNPSPSADSNLVHYLQARRGSSAGYTDTPNSVSGPCMSSKGCSKIGLGSGSGYQVPSRVVTMDGGGIRNPALLNQPVLASHRDPQLSPRDHNLGYSREGSWQQSSAQNFYQGLAQHAQRDSSQSTRGPASSNFSQQSPHNSSLHALGDVLSMSNLSATDVEQLCKYASSGHAGNLNQLITQLQLVSELAHAQSEPAQPLVETTHRVVIPTAHLKDRSHAVSRQAAAPLVNMRVQSGRPTVADGGNRASQPHQGRAAEASAPRELPSALDVVAEAACEEAANEEPSELLMLAAETLAGLNSMQPWQAADHSSLEATPGNDSPAAAQKLSKQLGDANRKQKRKLAQVPKAAATSNVTTVAAAHASSGGASVHPILGFSVPHSRRSYHRDAPAAAAAKDRSSAPLAASEVRKGPKEFKSSAAAAPAAGRQRKPSAAAPHARSAFAARSAIPRAASDSSLTVSADST